AEDFRGRTFVIVGHLTPSLIAAFERIERARFVCHEEHGQPLAAWHVIVCHRFRGVVSPVESLGLERY
ncbi:MAG: hypothetical protein RMJ52_08305, partial [Gemmataceae bacterium]|nr:hypothetical protein [Gemmataceae bacterium]